MARACFVEDFDYKLTSRTVIAYRKGWEGTVKRDCLVAAMKAGCAVEIQRWSRAGIDPKPQEAAEKA